jgi:hypothetical protein
MDRATLSPPPGTGSDDALVGLVDDAHLRDVEPSGVELGGELVQRARDVLQDLRGVVDRGDVERVVADPVDDLLHGGRQLRDLVDSGGELVRHPQRDVAGDVLAALQGDRQRLPDSFLQRLGESPEERVQHALALLRHPAGGVVAEPGG